jgi:hypothetical protein
MKSPKVFGIGFHKTGTTSLGKALALLGYRVCGDVATADPLIGERAIGFARQLTREYDAFQDNPWPIIYRELAEWYPDGKFILTVRDTDKWLASVVEFFKERDSPMRAWIYGAGVARGNEAIYRERFERHNREVRAFFRDRPGQFLELDFAAGDGWEKLCPFLSAAVPIAPFPRVKPLHPRRKMWV